MKLAQFFFTHPAKDVAIDLLGKIICRQSDDGTITRHRITETEAYPGDCPYVFTEPQFYSIGEWIALEDMLMISCTGDKSPDNIVIRGIDGNNDSSKAVAAALNIVSGELYSHDLLWIEDDGTKINFIAGERSFLPDGDLVNFKVTEIL